MGRQIRHINDSIEATKGANVSFGHAVQIWQRTVAGHSSDDIARSMRVSELDVLKVQLGKFHPDARSAAQTRAFTDPI